jgi:hypothetical protein
VCIRLISGLNDKTTSPHSRASGSKEQSSGGVVRKDEKTERDRAPDLPTSGKEEREWRITLGECAIIAIKGNLYSRDMQKNNTSRYFIAPLG